LRAFSSKTARTIVVAIVLMSAARQAVAAADLLLTLHPEHRAHEARLRDAADDTIAQFSEWFGPAPFERLAIDTIPSGQTAPPDQPGRIVVPIHWLQPQRSLLMEAAVARAIARQWWGVSIEMPDQFLSDGIAEYAQGRAVERIYDRRHQRMAYSTYEARYFGNLVPWAIRALRLDRATAGVDRTSYRSLPDVDVQSTDAEHRRARAAKIAAALVTLERYIGWPALQRGLSLANQQYAGRRMSADEFAQTLNDAAERDLSWFLAPVLNGPTRWDYAVESITTSRDGTAACGGASCVRSTIVVRRLGNTAFTGTSQEPAGDFEAGRAIEIELEFADGQKISQRWDGRAETRSLVYDAPSGVVRATVDPRDVLTMDLTRLNNTRRVDDRAARAGILAWSARWAIRLQDLLLTHAFLY
jgi:hypothetical protein